MQEIIHQIEISGPRLSQTFVLPEGVTTIGRQDSNNLVFVHPLVSRKHAQLACTKDACTITDLGSTHGTMLNRERIEGNTPITLNDGDVIEIGAFRLVYHRLVIGDEEDGDEPTDKLESDEEDVVKRQTAVSGESEPVPGVAIQEWQTAQFIPLARQAYLPKNGNGHRKRGEKPFSVPPGLSMYDSTYLNYLPEIYRRGYNSFISRFLALLESILAPIEWNIDNFDLYLDPKTSPADFLPWLANWFDLTFDSSWSEEASRQILIDGHKIYERRGTSWALQRTLEIYTNTSVEIEDDNENLEPFTFAVRITGEENQFDREAIEKLINMHKPVHTTYTLIFL